MAASSPSSVHRTHSILDLPTSGIEKALDRAIDATLFGNHGLVPVKYIKDNEPPTEITHLKAMKLLDEYLTGTLTSFKANVSGKIVHKGYLCATCNTHCGCMTCHQYLPCTCTLLEQCQKCGKYLDSNNISTACICKIPPATISNAFNSAQNFLGTIGNFMQNIVNVFPQQAQNYVIQTQFQGPVGGGGCSVGGQKGGLAPPRPPASPNPEMLCGECGEEVKPNFRCTCPGICGTCFNKPCTCGKFQAIGCSGCNHTMIPSRSCPCAFCISCNQKPCVCGAHQSRAAKIGGPVSTGLAYYKPSMLDNGTDKDKLARIKAIDFRNRILGVQGAKNLYSPGGFRIKSKIWPERVYVFYAHHVSCQVYDRGINVGRLDYHANQTVPMGDSHISAILMAMFSEKEFVELSEFSRVRDI